MLNVVTWEGANNYSTNAQAKAKGEWLASLLALGIKLLAMY